MSRVLLAAVFIAACLPVSGSAGPPTDDAEGTGVAAATSRRISDSCRAHYRRALVDEKLALAAGDRDGALEAVLRAHDIFHSCAPSDPAPREIEHELSA